MSDQMDLPVRAELQATFRAFMPRLAAAFGVDPSAVQPMLADLSTGRDIIKAVSMITMNPMFKMGYRTQDGDVIPQLKPVAEALVSEDANGDEIIIGFKLNFQFFHPVIGQPSTLAVIILSSDDAVVSLPGATARQNAAGESGFEPGLITQLLSMLPPEGAAELAALFLALIQTPEVQSGTAAADVVQGVVQEVVPFLTGAAQPSLPAPDPEADYDTPFSADLLMVVPELMRMADATLGLDPADADSLSTAFYKLATDLNAKSEDMTPRNIASLLEQRPGLRFLLDKNDGKITTAGLVIELTNDAGDVVDLLALGVSSDVAIPALLNCAGLQLIVGQPDESDFDAQQFAVFARSSDTMSEAKAKENRELVIRALVAIQPFTDDDNHAENLRRQAFRLLKSSLIR